VRHVEKDWSERCFSSSHSLPLSSLLHFRLTLSARPPVLHGERGAMRGGDEGGGSFSPVGCWRGAPEAPAIAPRFAPAPPAPLPLPLPLLRLLFHSPRLRLSAEAAELPFPCEGGSGGQAPSESCGDEAIFLGGGLIRREKEERKGREASDGTSGGKAKKKRTVYSKENLEQLRRSHSLSLRHFLRFFFFPASYFPAFPSLPSNGDAVQSAVLPLLAGLVLLCSATRAHVSVLFLPKSRRRRILEPLSLRQTM